MGNQQQGPGGQSQQRSGTEKPDNTVESASSDQGLGRSTTQKGGKDPEERIMASEELDAGELADDETADDETSDTSNKTGGDVKGTRPR